MESLQELKDAISTGKQLVWNDPDPIPGNDYRINWVEPIYRGMGIEFDKDCPLLIQYGRGSEAEVYIHEISILK